LFVTRTAARFYRNNGSGTFTKTRAKLVNVDGWATSAGLLSITIKTDARFTNRAMSSGILKQADLRATRVGVIALSSDNFKSSTALLFHQADGAKTFRKKKKKKKKKIRASRRQRENRSA